MGKNNIKCLIIDDDPFIRDLLLDKINQYIPDLDVMETAGSGTEGMKIIAQYDPDLIFLDVEMNDMTGFEMLQKIEQINFKIIFITSYSHYAIKAIRFNALDYLVKPIDLGELKQAIKSYKRKSKNKNDPTNLRNAYHNINSINSSDHKLILHTQEGELRLVVKDIICMTGDRNYSYIYLKNNKKKLVTKTLADLEDLLHDTGFFRCHRSHLVNYIHIQSYPTSISIELSNGMKLPIARRKKNEFKLWWESQNSK